MKIRQGFVSNSSSSSFVLRWSDLTGKEKQMVKKMEDQSWSLSRCTGYIPCDTLEDWIGQLDFCQDNSGYTIIGGINLTHLVQENKVDGKNNLIIIRESDEGMSGRLEDYGDTGKVGDYDEMDENSEWGKVLAKAIAEFEYH